MNQILYTANGKPNGPLPIQAIIKFFAFAIIALGVIFIGEASYYLFSPNAVGNKVLDNTVPQIEFAKDGNKAVVTIAHNKGIVNVKYNWNEEEKVIERGDDRKEIVLHDLSIPSGTNILYVEATDINGQTARSSFEYAYDGIAIELSVINNSHMKIVATDVTGMSYMTFHWNNEEDVKVYPNEDGEIFIEQTTEIPSGLNTLHITAVNTSNITLTKKQEVKGNKKPQIDLYIQGTKLFVTVTDEEGVDKVVQKVNVGEEQVYDGGGQKEFKYEYDVGEEDILVTITATDVEGVSRTIKGKNY